MFQHTIELYDEYRRLIESVISPSGRNLAGEVRKRLKQLDWLAARVRVLNDDYIKPMARHQDAIKAHLDEIGREKRNLAEHPLPEGANLTKDEWQQVKTSGFELEMHAESFYYIAHRIMKIVQHKQMPLPELHTFKAVAVRDVRNHLLEHPEGSQILTQSWGTDVTGPALKSMRKNNEPQTFKDAGFFPNAEQFKKNFEDCLRKAIVHFR